MNKPKVITRLSSMFLDHIIMTLVLLPLFIGYILLLAAIFSASYPDNLSVNAMASYGIILIPFLVYVGKDSFGSRSAAKRMTGLNIIDNSTLKPASSFQCFLRNIFIPIWPLEVLITVFNPTRRLGDLIANTKVIVAPKESGIKVFSDIKRTKISFQTVLIWIIGLGYCYLLGYLMTLI